MMDNPTANKNHIPCQSWAGQNGWSTTSSQGGHINPLTSSQHLSLGMASNQRPSYDHLQASNQSCMSDLSGRNSIHHTPLYRAPQISSVSSSTSLFGNTSIPSASHVTSFAHTSSMPITANQGKNIPTSSHPQTNQRLQPCRPQNLSLLSQHEASFQTPLASQGVPNRLQDLSVSMPSYGEHEQPQWTSSSHCRGAVNEPVPDAGVHSDKEPLQEGNMLPMMSSDGRRSALLHQRAQLLKQLAEMDKILDSLPPDDSGDGHSAHTAVQSSPSMDDSSRCEQTTTSDGHRGQLSAEKSHPSADCSSPPFYDDENETYDALEDPMSADESVKEENSSAESCDDSDPDYLPDSDGDCPDPPSKTEDCSSDEISHGSPSTPTDKTPPRPGKKAGKSETSEPKEESVTPTKKPRETHRKKLSETLVMPCSNSKTQRVYDKKNYCLFCAKPMGKISRHLQRLHSDRAEVAAMFQYPHHSAERRKIVNRLRNQGNFEHNKTVLKTGKGHLVVRKRPNQTAQAQDYLHCLYCQGLFQKNHLFRHMKNCPEKGKNDSDSDTEYRRKRTASRCMLLTVNCADLGINDTLKDIIGDMVNDEVMQVIINDRIILQYAEQMFDQYGRDVKKHHYIRQNLRQMGRLVLEAQKITPMQSLEDFFHPSNFRHVVSAVNVLAGYDSEHKTYSTPSLAVKLGYSLQKTCGIVEANAVKSGDTKVAESAKNFISVYRKKWNKLISSGALSALRKTKSRTEKEVPFAEDVKRLQLHLEKSHVAAEKKLRESPSTDAYVALARVMLARTIIFNRRKPREVSSVHVTAFMSRKKSDVPDDMDVSVSDLERTMCGFFSRVDIRGDCGRKVPIFLKPSFIPALELLVSVREACGTSSKNPFLFARPNAMTAYKGTDSIRKLVKECGAPNPEALTCKKLQKHFSTMLLAMNLDENEANQILGPNNQVQVLRQNSSADDSGTVVRARTQPGRTKPAATWDHSGGSSSGSKFYNQQACGVTSSTNTSTSSKSVGSGQQGNKDSSYKPKQKWDEAEVRAVERHLMSFIRRHKVPGKDDCIQCLEAEAKALQTRSWKGVKDYVRNRITALQRQSGHSRKSSKKT